MAERAVPGDAPQALTRLAREFEIVLSEAVLVRVIVIEVRIAITSTMN